MKKCILFAVLLLTFSGSQLIAQESNTNYATPKNMLEVGMNGGVMLVAGDLDAKAGFAGGIHVRKALDYIFSLRADLLAGVAEGEKMSSGDLRTFETTWTSGTVYGVVSLNSLRWDKPVRNTNLYVMVGGGGNRFETTYITEFDRVERKIKPDFNPHGAAGAGISFRLNPRLNIGLEGQGIFLFGGNADKLDGINFETGSNERSLFRDILMTGGLTINFNLGNPSSKAEPLYWINPLDVVLNDINEIKQRPDVTLEDSDGDGVIDALDQEQNTPEGAIVDTKGRTLDSDRDNVPDYLDREPFYTPREGEEVNDEGVVINPINGGGMGSTGGGVTEDRVRELIGEALDARQLTDTRTSVAEWFLPMVHFGTNSYRVKYSDYGNLASIARMMNSNPGMRLVVTGFTDSTGDETTNNSLSYQRANAVIEHLVNNHNVSRGNLVLNWKGSEAGLVPSTSSYMNRRVEFRVAGAGDYEMSAPSGDGGY